MKRVFACCLLVLLLAGCGAEKEGQVPDGEMTLPKSEVEVDPNGDYVITLEWPEYDPSIRTVWFMLENHSGEEIETGVDYQLETLSDNGGWYQVPMVENAAWNVVALCVPDGESIALACSLSVFDYDFSSGGTYRIVKEIGGETCAGTFRLTEGAPISAEAPYGFGPLEDLPADYGAANAGETDVVFTGDGVKNGEAVETFLQKVRLDIPCQLRTVQDYGEGAVMVIDVIYENDHFLWRMWNSGAVTEQRFSYIVTDGADLYLSNGADWETAERYANKELAWLVPQGTGTWLVEDVEQMTVRRLEGNSTRYKVWSADGVWCAGLPDSESYSPTEFFVSWQKAGEGSRGSTYDLNCWDGLETAIWGLEWQEDETLLLVCETVDGGASRLVFDPETETLRSE